MNQLKPSTDIPAAVRTLVWEACTSAYAGKLLRGQASWSGDEFYGKPWSHAKQTERDCVIHDVSTAVAARGWRAQGHAVAGARGPETRLVLVDPEGVFYLWAA